MRLPRFAIALLVTFVLFSVLMRGVGGLAMASSSSWMMSRMLFPLLVVVAVALLARPRHSWHERRRASGRSPLPLSGTPEEILRQRFAQGELSRDAYRDSIIEVLKDRYVSGELTLEEYESRVGTMIGLANPPRLEGDAPRGYI